MEKELIIETVNQITETSYDDLRGGIRTRKEADARHIAMWLFHKNTNMTLKEIGKLFNRHYSTVIFGIVKIESLRNFELKNIVTKIELILGERASEIY